MILGNKEEEEDEKEEEEEIIRNPQRVGRFLTRRDQVLGIRVCESGVEFRLVFCPPLYS
jgi:hypothetical protein